MVFFFFDLADLNPKTMRRVYMCQSKKAKSGDQRHPNGAYRTSARQAIIKTAALIKPGAIATKWTDVGSLTNVPFLFVHVQPEMSPDFQIEFEIDA